MSTPEALVIPAPSALPEALRQPIHGVSLAAYLVVEAARLDALAVPAVLDWLGVSARAFARAEGPWSDRVAEALAQALGINR